MHPKQLSIQDYTYHLPNDRIAAVPLVQRDAAKLLVYKKGMMLEDSYENIAAHLPNNSLLIFNNTRVIQARLLFQKPTGGIIEIFCLEPYETITDYAVIMRRPTSIQWKCLIGGASKWKEGVLQKTISNEGRQITLQAKLIEKRTDEYIVELSWQPAELFFADVIEQMGDTPLPPYIKRKADEADKERYQTIYATQDGSVAAPTAGLHFTSNIFETLQAKNITSKYLTLHVGAGTFRPVKAAAMALHEMHAEWIDVSEGVIEILIANMDNGIVAVGTTSLRTLESLYWMGVKTLQDINATIQTLSVKQWEVYEAPLVQSCVEVKDALQALLRWMKQHKLQQIFTTTQIIIAPGYCYKIPIAIVTNFHQPQSTLLLLVAAAIGDDWKKVYDYALKNSFRFLSYGDGSLLFLPPKQV